MLQCALVLLSFQWHVLRACVVDYLCTQIRGLVSYLAKQDEQLSRTPLLSLAAAPANAIATASGGASAAQLPYSDYLRPPPPKPPTRATPVLVQAPVQPLSTADAILNTLFARPAPTPAPVVNAPPVLLPACAGLCPEALEDGASLCSALLPPMSGPACFALIVPSSFLVRRRPVSV